MNKPTNDLYRELNYVSHIDKYLKDNDAFLIDSTLSDYLCDKLEQKGISKAS